MRRDWLAQIKDIPESSNLFWKIVKEICPDYKRRAPTFAPDSPNTISNNSYVLFRQNSQFFYD